MAVKIAAGISTSKQARLWLIAGLPLQEWVIANYFMTTSLVMSMVERGGLMKAKRIASTDSFY